MLESFPAGGLAVVVGATGGTGGALLARLAGERALRGAVGLGRSGDPPLDLTAEETIARRRPRRRHGPRAAARGRRDRVPARRRARAREELAPARPRAHGEGVRRQRHRPGAPDEALPAAAPARRQVGV